MSKGDGGEGVVDVESAPESESESEPERAVERIIGRLGLRPHPEGGWYAETWRESGQVRGARAAGTAIYFLLRAGERSHWHRIDSAEIWHHYAGAPLELRTWTDAGGEVHRRLGTDLAGGERPQLVVAPGDWQSAASLGEWTLVGCTVSPGFEFEHFELAAPGWAPAADGDAGDAPVSC